MNRIKLQYNTSFFTGDIHGEFIELYRKLKKYEITDCNIILCGDVGIGFEPEFKLNKFLKYFNKLFYDKNIQVYAFRGNHDDPKYFNIENINKYKNIHLIPDYTILENDTDNILCIGGAYSVDRVERTINKTYWENEIVVYNDDIKLLNDITIVATHTSPAFTYPFTKGGLDHWKEKDPKIIDDVASERKILSDIYFKLKEKNNIKKWYYGHYHQSKYDIIFDTKFKLLDILEIGE